MKKLLPIMLLFFVAFSAEADSNIRPANNEKIGNVIVWGEYTRNNMFERGDVFWVWKVAIVPKQTPQKELLSIAKQLISTYPNKRIRIFNDTTKIKQFIERDIYFNDKTGLAKKVDFPAEWVRKHHVANINDRSDVAENRWQLVDRFGKHIAFLE